MMAGGTPTIERLKTALVGLKMPRALPARRGKREKN